MSGLLEARAQTRKPLMVILGSAVAGAVAAGALWWASTVPVQFEGHSLQPACTALVLDRDSGITATAPCPNGPMLFAGTQSQAKP